MTTLRTRIQQAAFWDHQICLACHATFEFAAEDGSCPECGSELLIPAAGLDSLLEAISEEE